MELVKGTCVEFKWKRKKKSETKNKLHSKLLVKGARSSKRVYRCFLPKQYDLCYFIIHLK